MSTLEEVEKQVAARKKEAEEKYICGKVFEIVKGMSRNYDRTRGSHTSGGITEEHEGDTYKGRDFVVEYFSRTSYGSDGGGGGSTTWKVTYKGTLVFHDTYHTLEVFIPGEWEKPFNDLYRRAFRRSKAKVRLKAKQEKQVKRVADEAAAQKARKNFGL